MRVPAYLFAFLLSSVSCNIQKLIDAPSLQGHTQPTGVIKKPLSYTYSYYEQIGSRSYMEDRHVICTTENYMIAAVFDGHGGSTVSGWLKEHFPQRLIQALEDLGEGATINDQESAIKKLYQNLDRKLFNKLIKKNDGSGSTAVVYLVIKYPDKEKREMLINLGDSRAIVTKGKKVTLETKDHKPDDLAEENRIRENRGKIAYKDDMAVAVLSCKWPEGQGALRVTRAVGDFHFKVEDPNSNEYFSKWISAEPDIYEINTKPDDYIVLASDGLWDYMNSEEVAAFIAQNPPQNIAEALAQRAQSIGKARQRFAQRMGWHQHGQDNISIIVLRREKGK